MRRIIYKRRGIKNIILYYTGSSYIIQICSVFVLLAAGLHRCTNHCGSPMFHIILYYIVDTRRCRLGSFQ